MPDEETGAEESVTQQAREEMNVLDQEFEDRLAGFEQKVDSALQRQAEKKKQEERKFETTYVSGRDTGQGMMLASIMLGFPLVGLGIGWLVDRGTNSNIFAIAGALAGSIAGIAIVIRMTSEKTR